MGLLPTKIVPGENETLLRQEKLFQGKVMVERVSVNLNGPLEYDSEEEERPASPAQDSEPLYAVILHVSLAMSLCALINIIQIFQDLNLSVDKNTCNETSSKSFSVFSIEFVDKESSKDDKQ